MNRNGHVPAHAVTVTPTVTCSKSSLYGAPAARGFRLNHQEARIDVHDDSLLVAAAAFTVVSAAVPAGRSAAHLPPVRNARGRCCRGTPGAPPQWNAPLASYSTAGLTDDVVKLLSFDAPVLTRMENLRRATIYAQKDAVLARQLLDAVMAPQGVDRRRCSTPAILIESYKQAVMIRRQESQPAWAAVDETIKTDGYAL